MNTQPADAAGLMERIRAKSASIVNQQRRANAGRFGSMYDALALQQLRKDRKALQAQLPPLALV